MTDDRIDFSPLDPTRDKARFDAIVGSTVDRAAGELRARASRDDTLAQLATWHRPMLAAAVLVTVIVSTVMLTLRREGSAPATAGIAEAAGVPDDFAEWLRAGQMPDAAELLMVFEDGS